MTMIRKILFPVDFSASCEAMAPYVRRAMTILSAKVTLLYVLENSTSSFELWVRPVPDAEKDRETIAQTKLNSFLASEFPVQECSRLLLTGDAASQISKAVMEGGFDLIIMPTHTGAFRRMLLGSTTAKVLDEADCPVLTTQHAETLSPRRVEHREWVCALGLNEDSARILQFAKGIAEDAHVNLTLVHAIPASKAGSPIQLNLGQRKQPAHQKAVSQRIEQLQESVGSHARVVIADGPLKDTLTEAAHRLQADVLVIGRSPQPGTLGRLRDLSYAITRDAPCPVLSV